MRKFSIIAVSALLVACSSGEYITDVQSESYREEYQTANVSQPMTNAAVSETDVASQSVRSQQALVRETPVAEPAAVTPMVKPMAPRPKPMVAQQSPSNNKLIRIVAPTQKQKERYKRFGYTIQVLAVDSSRKAMSKANQLPQGHPIWEHYKQVNGTEWYAVLYGDYATKSEAKAAIATLPKYFRDLKPFVKSLDDIKNSNYPQLKKLR